MGEKLKEDKSYVGRPKVAPPTAENRAALNKAANMFESNAAFIDAIGVAPSTYYKWRRGEKWMSYKIAFRIEKITEGNVKAVDLLPKQQGW